MQIPEEIPIFEIESKQSNTSSNMNLKINNFFSKTKQYERIAEEGG